jgi:hypothetical protein
VLAFVVLMILPPAATAATGADPSNPSLDQYVESVPTSHGDPPSGGGSTHGHITTSTGRLPASVRHDIAAHGGPDAAQLQAIATSPAFGAPATVVRSSTGTGTGTGATAGDSGGSQAQKTPAAPARAGHRPSGIAAIANSATDGEAGSTGLLLVGVLLISALLGGTALARKRYGAT